MIRRLVSALALSLVVGACTANTVSTTTDVDTSVGVTSTTEPATVSTDTASTSTEPEVPPLWMDNTEAAIGTTAGWSNKVELADIDADGDVDLLFADGGDYESPGEPVVSQVWVNNGTGVFEDHSTEVLGETGDLTRVIKVRDLNSDGLVDIFVGTTYQTQSRLLLGTGGLGYREVTDTNLPQVPLSVGDAEVGDVDGDGDLDLALADWGPGSPMSNTGGRVQLWLNDGTGAFDDVTAELIPDAAVRFSWELEFVDADNDWDLDLVVSCKLCTGGFYFVNDGSGSFSDASDLMPQFTNNYDFEVVDIDGDGFQDLITINDGPSFREHVFRGDGSGGFMDATDELWPRESNLGGDDNMIVILDYDSDGDPDILVGSLSLPDRLLVNDGTGVLSLFQGPTFDGRSTNGTLGIAVADLNGDGRIDVAQAQGEASEDDRAFIGTAVEPDTAGPVIGATSISEGILRARIHDNKTPVVSDDFQRVYLEGPEGEADLQWYGEALWQAPVTGSDGYQVCAVDRVGNRTCMNI